MNAQAYDAIRATLVEKFGWDVSGYNACKRTKNGEASFGLDGSVVVFYRRHPSGYPLANLTLGTVEVNGAEAAAEVERLVESYNG